MSCHGVNAFNPACQLKEAATTATTDAFTNIAHWFGQAAAEATTWLWREIGSATSINLDSPHLSADLQVTAAIAAVLCLGLFVIQVITATLRQEPGALARAAKGLVVALVASVFALAVTKVLLGVVDALSEGVVAYTMNTNLEGLGRQFALVDLASGGIANPVVLILFSVVVLAAVVVVWAAMMIRKMMIIIAAVLAPLAFSGATADITRSWVRRWVEFMAAMIASKLLLVIIMMVGLSVVQGAGQTDAGVGQSATQLGAGALILLMGGFAPWVAIKMFHFTGDALHTAHASAAQAPAGARTLVSAPQKMLAIHSHAASAMPGRGHAGPSHTGRASQSGSGEPGTAPAAPATPTGQSADVLHTKAVPAPGGPGTSSSTGIGANGTAAAGPPSAAIRGDTAPGGSAPQPAGGSAGAGPGLRTGTTSGGAAGAGTAGGASAGAGAGAGAAAAPVAAAAITVGAAHRVGKATGQATQNPTPAATPEPTAAVAPEATATPPPAAAPAPRPAPQPAPGVQRPQPPGGRTPTKPT